MKKLIFALTVLLVLVLSVNVMADRNYTVSRLKLDMELVTRGHLGLADSIWVESINAGIQDIATTVDCDADTITQILAAGTAIYALPATCMKLWGVIDKSGGRAYDIIQLENAGKAGTGMEVEESKVYWTTMRIKSMIFYPAPAVAETVLVYFFRVPATVSLDTATIEIAEAYHPALVYACLLRLWERLERYDLANRDAVLQINLINRASGWLSKPGPDVIVGNRVISREQ